MQLLWAGDPMWWQWDEWTKLQSAQPSLPTWDVAALRELLPRTLVPDAGSIFDLVDVERPMVKHLSALMAGAGDLHAATQTWLGVQRAHRIVIVRPSDPLRTAWPTPAQIDEALAALDTIAPEVTQRAESDWNALFDDAPLLVDASHFTNDFDCLTHPYPDFGYGAWADQIDDWLRERQRFGRPSDADDWEHHEPRLPDYVAWRDAWRAVLDAASALVLSELAPRRS